MKVLAVPVRDQAHAFGRGEDRARVALGLRHVRHHAEHRRADVAEERVVGDRGSVGARPPVRRRLLRVIERLPEPPPDVGYFHMGTSITCNWTTGGLDGLAAQSSRSVTGSPFAVIEESSGWRSPSTPAAALTQLQQGEGVSFTNRARIRRQERGRRTEAFNELVALGMMTSRSRSSTTTSCGATTRRGSARRWGSGRAMTRTRMQMADDLPRRELLLAIAVAAALAVVQASPARVQAALGKAETVAPGVDLYRLSDPALLSPPGLVAVQLLRIDPDGCAWDSCSRRTRSSASRPFRAWPTGPRRWRR